MASHDGANTRQDRRFTGDPTRARILDAAVASFATRGFHATSTRMIAAGAGISPAAVYIHHKTKEEILFQISREGHVEALDVVLAAIATESTPPARLHALVRDFVGWHAARHTLARIVQYEMDSLTPEHTAQIADLRRRTRNAVGGVVLDGIETGDFTVADPRTTTLAVLSLGIDVARWYRSDGEWSPQRVGADYADLALRLVGYDPEKAGK